MGNFYFLSLAPKFEQGPSKYMETDNRIGHSWSRADPPESFGAAGDANIISGAVAN